MKKYLKTLIVLLTGISATAYSQENVSDTLISYAPPPYITAAAGVAIPLGAFGSTNKSDHYPGFATVGRNIFVQGSMPLMRYMGITAALNANNNPVDAKGLARQYDQGILWFYPHVTTVAARNYNSIIFSTGVFVTVPVQRLTFDLNAMIGLGEYTFPEIWVDVNGKNGYGRHANSTGRYAATFSASTNIRYRVNANWYVLLNVAYYSAQVHYYVNSDLYLKYHLQQTIQQLTASLGVAYQFGSKS
jgi:hypothetical protein